VEGDLRDGALMGSLLSEFQPDAVMHFAARALVGESVADPAMYYEANVAGTLDLLRSIRGMPRLPVFIFSSTCSVYGVTDEPLSELNPIAPMNPYARSKRMIEEVLKDFEAAYGLRSVILRYFNASGADPEGEIGELHEPETHLIPRLLLHVLNPAAYPVQIFGEDYETEDGTCVRDYVHVEDLARAHITAMERLLSGSPTDIINLGTTKGSSVREVISVVEKVTGTKLKISVGPRRAGDPPRLVAGSKKARNLLAWTPAHDLESIVKTAWAFTRARRNQA
jgi:UDP-glucose-4-epimerase GalE